MTEGWEPYAWQLTVTGERGPDGVPYCGTTTGVDAYESPEIRAAIEDMAQKSFTHQYPGVWIASVRWYPLYELDDDTDACGHGDNPDETCEGCYG
jgi:hypothetical protein